MSLPDAPLPRPAADAVARFRSHAPHSLAGLAEVPLRTQRLEIRPLRGDDAAEVWAYQSDPNTLRFIPWPTRDREAAAEHTRRRSATQTLAADGDAVFLAVVAHDGPHAGRLLGDVMLRAASLGSAQLEMGWVFATEFQGLGYAAEACLALRDYAIEGLGAARLVAHLDPRNAASARLCARLGMRVEGLALEAEADERHGEWAHLQTWAMLAADRGLPQAAPDPSVAPPTTPLAGTREPRFPVHADTVLAEPIRAERLLLRPLETRDAADIWALQRDAETIAFLPWPARTEAEGAAETARRAGNRQLTEDGDVLSLAAELTAGPESGTVIAQLKLSLVSAADECLEVGWTLSPEHRGLGYAEEAARAALRLAFERIGAHRVVARLDPRNLASAALCARLGMRHEALSRAAVWREKPGVEPEWLDLAEYAITADEWRRATRPPR